MADLGERHDEHDPLRIAALLDRDLDPGERASAEALVAGCPACAALHADLVVLAIATPELPTPARTRGFQLTAADAARLSEPAGEPRATTPRLTSKMPDPTVTSAHATHDTILVASLADRSLTEPEREAGEALVAACRLCAEVYADLVALRVATQALPTPRRSRDFSLTPADAARLRPAGWRRWVAGFGTPRDIFSRPLAVGLTTLGLAGLLVTTAPSVLQGQAIGGPTAAQDSSSAAGGGSRNPAIAAGAAEGGPSSAPGAFAPAPSAGTTSAGFGPAVAPAAASPGAAADASGAPVVGGSNGFLGDRTGSVASPPALGVTSGDTSKASGGRTNEVEPAGAAGGPPAKAEPAGSTPLVVSGVLLLVGLGLFLMRWAARGFKR